MTKDYTAHETISLKNHVVYSEKWVQEIIANDPSVLRMGDLVLGTAREPSHGLAGSIYFCKTLKRSGAMK
jgi:hypothetical protein